MLFKLEGEEIAAGRTPNQVQAVEAVWDWLDDLPLAALYEHFDFVDWQKRLLLRIRDAVVSNFPSLDAAARIELTNRPGSALSHLWFLSEGRSAHLYFHGEDPFPIARFHWDQCELFAFSAADYQTVASVLNRWICDNATPSSMREEFPWLKMGWLADYYENGNPIEGEFIQSWDKMEQFYSRMTFPFRSSILLFISELRRAGFDRKLRAGQSVWTFIVSRSRRHRLRPGQPRVSFQFSKDGMNVVPKNYEGKCIYTASISMSGEVDDVLTQLVKQPIT
jgi:hypothetical protein